MGVNFKRLSQRGSALLSFRGSFTTRRISKVLIIVILSMTGVFLLLASRNISPSGPHTEEQKPHLGAQTSVVERVTSWNQENGYADAQLPNYGALFGQIGQNELCTMGSVFSLAFETLSQQYEAMVNLIINASQSCPRPTVNLDGMFNSSGRRIQKWRHAVESQLSFLSTNMEQSNKVKKLRVHILQFCLQQCPLYPDTVTEQFFHQLYNSPLRQQDCNVLDKAPIKILNSWNHDSNCVQRDLKSEMKPDCSLCILLLPTIASEIEFKRTHRRFEPETSPCIIVAPAFTFERFRPDNDLLMTTVAYFELFNTSGKSTTPLLNKDRSFLISLSIGVNDKPKAGEADYITELLSELKSLPRENTDVYIAIHQTENELLGCWDTDMYKLLVQAFGEKLVWFPCSISISLLKKSVFSLVPISQPSNIGGSQVNTLSWQIQLLLCLEHGAIPVLIGEGQLPFPKAIGEGRWSQATLHISPYQLDQLLPVLRKLSASEIENLQNNGQKLFKQFLQDIPTQTSTLLLELSLRLGLSRPPAPQWKTVMTAQLSINLSYHAQHMESFPNSSSAYPGFPSLELSNIIQPPFMRPEGRTIVNPFWSFPSTPWDIAPPQTGFTAVIVFYDRLNVLFNTLTGLKTVQYLQSVIVVWNYPEGPSLSIQWPTLPVPLKILQAPKNSLNNRFLPLDLITTEAVLVLDDDVQLNPEEHEVGFKVWRENPDRIVGYPERGHAFDPKRREWHYFPGTSENYSMILTGGAFLHKYYFYTYTWDMPLEVRELVDRKKNCEDIAMNFHIAHLTRKPPIKVSNRFLFPCDGCAGNQLSLTAKHYRTRSKCVHELARIYGYNPLIYTQFRVELYLGRPK